MAIQVTTSNKAINYTVSGAIADGAVTKRKLASPFQLSPTAGTNVTINQNDCYQTGYTVEVTVSITMGAAISSETVLISGLPTAYRGATYQRMFLAWNNTQSQAVRFFFSNSGGGTNMGRIGTKAALASGDNIRFTYVYICQ